MSRRLFVETVIRCDLDTLWERTQDPAAHQRWDLLFRPLMRWGTAWSFDRLRLWPETGASPERSLRSALFDAGGRVAAGAIVGFEGSIALAVLTGVALLIVPPLPSTPAARRCRRQPVRSSTVESS